MLNKHIVYLIIIEKVQNCTACDRLLRLCNYSNQKIYQQKVTSNNSLNKLRTRNNLRELNISMFPYLNIWGIQIKDQNSLIIT